MHPPLSSLSGRPSPTMYLEKEHLAGVHYHEIFLSGESGTSKPPALKDLVTKSVKSRNGGTGVYFENKEVEDNGACIHPLHIISSTPSQASEGSWLPLPKEPCPVGQPLFAPPNFATHFLDKKDGGLGADGKLRIDPPIPLRVPGMLRYTDPSPSSVGQQYKRQKIRHTSSHHQEDEDSLFSDTNRTAFRLKLSSRDYRLSRDELEFVEAAVRLSSS